MCITAASQVKEQRKLLKTLEKKVAKKQPSYMNKEQDKDANCGGQS